MKKSKQFRRLTALFLALILLFGGALPAIGVSAAESITVIRPDKADVSDALRQQAEQKTPYELPPEAEGAVYVPLTLLQSGSLAARWPELGAQPQASGAETAFTDALTAFEPGVSLKAYGLSQNQVVDLMNNVINTRPELFYFAGVYMKMDGNKVDYAWFMYNAAISVVKAQVALLNAEVDYILSLIPAGLTPVEKVLWVNDYIAMYTYYPDLPVYNDPYDFNVYGILVEGEGVCQGYALANCLLLAKLDVACAFVTSDPMNHAWNLIQIDGAWYHVDTTWNDGAAEYGLLDVPGYVNHDFLLISDAVMRDADHQHTGWVAPAAANSNTYKNFFWTKTTSAIIPFEGKWYYFEDSDNWAVSGSNYVNPYPMRNYDFATGTDSSYMTLTLKVNPIPVDKLRFRTFRRTPSLAVSGGKFYFNDGKKIYSLTPGLEDMTAVHTETLNESNYQSICGFAIQHGQIKYGVFDLSGAYGRIYVDQPGPVLTAAPTLPDVPVFEVNTEGFTLRYGQTFKIVATPNATGFKAENEDLISVESDGTVRNIAFNTDDITGVWVYGPDGQYTYVIVEVYTAWWQWFIWIFLFGFIWY